LKLEKEFVYKFDRMESSEVENSLGQIIENHALKVQ
jgi:hypothetical protein